MGFEYNRAETYAKAEASVGKISGYQDFPLKSLPYFALGVPIRLYITWHSKLVRIFKGLRLLLFRRFNWYTHSQELSVTFCSDDTQIPDPLN